MGATHSKPDHGPSVVHNQTPIEFSREVVDYLEDSQVAPQTSLDSHIRSRIQAEVQLLRAEEEKVQQEIHRALERENLDREIAAEADGSSTNSATLSADLDEVRTKIGKYQSRRELSDLVSAKEAADAVVSCYGYNKATPLDCWQQVARFKLVVAEAETKYLASLR